MTSNYASSRRPVPGPESRNNKWPKASDYLQPANDNLPSDRLEKLYSLHEVEDSWDVSYSTLLREIQEEKLIATRVRGQWRVSASRLAEYLHGRERPLRLPGDRSRRRDMT